MSSGTQALRVRLARAAVLLAVLGVVCISSRQAAAQFGSLVVTMTSPASGSTVSGTITASASVSVIGALTVAGVQFQLDGANLGAEDTTAPYSIPWNTRTASNGSHTLSAVARDSLGVRWTSDPITVTVFNDTTAPVVTMTTPTAGSTVGGTVAVSASASDNVGVAGVQFRLDGAALGTEDTTAPYSISWNTTPVSNGSHSLTAIARDAAGNQTTSAPIAVTVLNDTTLPAVAIASPSSGASVVGTIDVTASASDNVGVAGVQFKVDGASLGAEDTTAPYSVSWNTNSVPDGSHTLTAVARDAAGNTATSVAVTVTVTNTVRTLRFEETSTAVSYLGGWNHGNTARSWSGGTAALGFAAGHRATFSFTGTAVSWIGFKGSFAGIANVYLDGPLVATVDSYAAEETVQAALFTASGLASGPHTLAIEATGTRNAASVDNIVVVDAFDVTGNFSDTTPPTVTITTPSGGTTVFGAVPVTASAADGMGVAGVRFLVDGAQVGAEDTVSPYSITWDTTDSHRWVAHADGDGEGRCRQHRDICGCDRHGVQRRSATDVDCDAVRGDGPVDQLHAGHAWSRTAGRLVARQPEPRLDAGDRLLQPVRRRARDVHLHRDIGDAGSASAPPGPASPACSWTARSSPSSICTERPNSPRRQSLRPRTWQPAVTR